VAAGNVDCFQGGRDMVAAWERSLKHAGLYVFQQSRETGIKIWAKK
jgi:hypothetical protein